MSLAHMIILGIIVLIVIPPEKLPELARQVAKFLVELKRSTDQIVGDLKQEALYKPQQKSANSPVNNIDEQIQNKLNELQNEINRNNKPIEGEVSAKTETAGIQTATADVKKNE